MRVKLGDPLAPFVTDVTLDGKRLDATLEASEEGGWVRELARDASGKFAFDRRNHDAVRVRMRAGAVRIYLDEEGARLAGLLPPLHQPVPLPDNWRSMVTALAVN